MYWNQSFSIFVYYNKIIFNCIIKISIPFTLRRLLCLPNSISIILLKNETIIIEWIKILTWKKNSFSLRKKLTIIMLTYFNLEWPFDLLTCILSDRPSGSERGHHCVGPHPLGHIGLWGSPRGSYCMGGGWQVPVIGVSWPAPVGRRGPPDIRAIVIPRVVSILVVKVLGNGAKVWSICWGCGLIVGIIYWVL